MNPPALNPNHGTPFLQPVPNSQPPQNDVPPPAHNGHGNEGNPFLQPIPNDQVPRNDPPPPAYHTPFDGNLYDDFEEPEGQPRFGGRHKPPPKSKKALKVSLKISGLNIKGNGDDKWYRVWQEMRETRTAVMIVGEAHMDDALRSQMNTLFARQLRVEFTPDPIAPRARAGLAIVLNKSLVLTEGVKTWEIIPGRAMLLEMKNVDGKTSLSILGVYAPNAPSKNADFWRAIIAWFRAHPTVRRPDCMGGDTNIVEAPIDRLPAHADNVNATDALDELKEYLRLVDGWRETYPTTCAYTYHQSVVQGGSQSRVDRIYIRRDLFDNTFEWGMQSVGLITDHRMVTVRLTTASAPTIGHGRWVWPAHIIRNKGLAEFIQEKGLRLQKELEVVARWPERDPEYNTQTLWMKFKLDIGEEARRIAKKVVPKIIEEIADIENKIDIILKDRTLNEEERTLSCAVLVEKLTQLQRRKHTDSRLDAQVRNRLEGQMIGRYWSMLNRENKPREVIHRLRKPGDPEAEPQYETNSKNMASMARDYHKKLQADRPANAGTADERRVREEKINIVLDRVQTTTTAEQTEELKKRLTLDDVRNALRQSANFKAPGLDGITYEVWKILNSRYETALKDEKPAFDIIGAMHKVYNDIEINGMVKGTGFSQSWMCPLYKKNDRAEIANYRPISLLNTDYKVFTEALTIKL
ncbi:Endonuclease/exonuclease/phosphatase, partial [Mycena alexandri]